MNSNYNLTQTLVIILRALPSSSEYPMRKEKGEEQPLKFLCILFSCKKNGVQNSAEISIARSRNLDVLRQESGQLPLSKCESFGKLRIPQIKETSRSFGLGLY